MQVVVESSESPIRVQPALDAPRQPGIVRSREELRARRPRAVTTRRNARDLPRDSRRALRSAYACHGKRAWSLVLLVLALPLWLPLLLVLVLINGVHWRGLRAAFFVQDRVGRLGRRFRMVKLRTLRDGQQATALGGILRRTHLDELPQLWNVLKGDMCLVGPRPETIAIENWASRGIPGFARRLQIRPGITGFAQVRQGHVGPELDSYREKLRLNDEYLARVSLRTDLAILLRTVTRVLFARGK